ncbi:unnamed protein product, partial [Porites lobata]
LLTTVKSSLSQQEVHNESRTTCGGFEWVPGGVSLCRKLVLIAFGLDLVLVMSRELSDIPEDSMSDVCGEVEEAALKVKLAYVEQEKALEIERLKQEQKLEEFKLKRELELSRAKLSVCKEIDNEQTPSLEEDLGNLPSDSKGEGVKRFLQSLTVTTRANETNTSVQSKVHVSKTPVLTTTSTPKSTTCGSQASAPSFLPGAVTQSVFTVRHFEPELGLPIQTEAACTQVFSSAKTDPVVTNSISGPSPITTTVMNSPSSYQFVHPQGQVNSFCEGWEKVASS